MNKNVHVTHRPDGRWQAISAGAGRPAYVTDTQAQAIDLGREMARNRQTELLIHGRDGRIRQRDSYGNDPCPPRDKC